MVKLLLTIFIGSGLGGVCRYLTTKGIEKIAFRAIPGTSAAIFPWGTLTVNIVGCFLIGLIYGLAGKNIDMTQQTRTFLTVGFCGGLTTFSTFSHESLILLTDGHPAVCAIYAAASLALGLLAAYAGHALT